MIEVTVKPRFEIARVCENVCFKGVCVVGYWAAFMIVFTGCKKHGKERRAGSVCLGSRFKHQQKRRHPTSLIQPLTMFFCPKRVTTEPFLHTFTYRQQRGLSHLTIDTSKPLPPARRQPAFPATLVLRHTVTQQLKGLNLTHCDFNNGWHQKENTQLTKNMWIHNDTLSIKKSLKYIYISVITVQHYIHLVIYIFHPSLYLFFPFVPLLLSLIVLVPV